jgi:hypothetical protein
MMSRLQSVRCCHLEGEPKMNSPWTAARLLTALAVALASIVPAAAQEKDAASLAQTDQAAELAKKLANPLASLISVPMQYNLDSYGGVNDGGSVSRLNIQPVIPFSLNEDWNLISRTIVPLVSQDDFPNPALNESGLGDTTASLFFSPKAPTAGGWIWGAGPVLLLPTATEDVLGTGKWGLGPTAVVLKQSGPWTVGMLANHIWGFGGDSSRSNVSATFLQPFVSYTTKTHTTFSANTESSYDWKTDQWTVPLNVAVSQLFKIGPQILQGQVAARYWATAPDGGPEGWGLRVQLTLLFPK